MTIDHHEPPQWRDVGPHGDFHRGLIYGGLVACLMIVATIIIVIIILRGMS